MDARIDWWLEAGGDEYALNASIFFIPLTSADTYSVFELEFDLEIPPTFASFIRLIQLNPEWEKAQNKNKPPKPKTDTQTLSSVRNILVKRLAQYPTTLKVSLYSITFALYFSLQ